MAPISKKIINSHSIERFDNFDNSYELLKKESLKHSMDLIRFDLKKLGIEHDIFFSETELVEKNLVDKAINQLKKDDYVVNGFLDPPKGELNKNWKKT